ALAGLAALLAGGIAPPSAARAQPAPAAPPRRLRLRAMPAEGRLGGPDAEPSPLLRLAPLDEAGAVIGDGGFPVLRVRLGEEVTLAVENGLGQPTGFHIRGLRGPNAADPVTDLAGAPLAPGAGAEIAFRARQSGTFLIQPVLAPHVAEQNARGLGAALIVEESPAPAFDHDLVLAVSDWRLDEKGRLAGDFNDRRDAARIGRLGNRLVANGAPAPSALAVRPGARLRVRMINTANARVIPLRVSGFPAQVYAIDSTPCQPFDPLKRTVTLSPGTRIELVIDAPRSAGQSGAIEARLGEGLPILRLTTEGAPLPPPATLAPLPDPGLPPAIRLQDAMRAECVIAGGAPREPAEAEPAALAARFPDPARIFTINGAPGGFSGRPLLSARRGAVIVLALVNRTFWPQVIAVHGHAFRLLHPFDDGWEPYFLDTLYLAPGTTARIAFIADNPGRWAIRSTIAEHFAAGVASWIEVR
ncbi:multicopper oxidase family protein, partial [Rhabdaerophilum calidifontis]|uniref:multicopper oxidase family protein n=1 Tax=Rhabdaerophilum calidifontis TaxID=2604328 RepID=UPI0012384D44